MEQEPGDGAATEASSSRQLLSLPQEIQEEIFAYAYHRPKNTKLLSRKSWKHHERMNRLTSPTYRMRPFPQIKVKVFLVSKAFFVAASKAYVGSQPYEGGAYLDGIVAAFTTAVVIRQAYLYHQNLPNLKKVRFDADLDDFALLATKDICEDEFVDEDFVEMAEELGIHTLRGLTEFEIVPEILSSETPQSEQRLWIKNIKALEDFLRAKVMLPLPEGSAYLSLPSDPFDEPIYYGSRVRTCAIFWETNNDLGHVSDAMLENWPWLLIGGVLVALAWYSAFGALLGNALLVFIGVVLVGYA